MMISKMDARWRKCIFMILIVLAAGCCAYSFNTVKADVATEEEITVADETTVIEKTTAGGEEIATADGEEETTLTDEKETTSEEESTIEEVDPDAYSLVAHRGYTVNAPENSIPAFEAAVEAGYTTIELDLRRCKEDANGNAAWVISHNDSLKKTMGEDVNISDLTYNEILLYHYTVGNGLDTYPNLQIASLSEVIDLIKRYKEQGLDITWQLEIKSSDDGNYTSYFEEEILEPLREADVLDCVMFSSFTYSYLKTLKNLDDSVTTWYLSTILDEEAIEKAAKCGAKGISFKGTVNYTTEENIKAALEQGFTLGCYTINNTVIMGAYYQWGVRSFATDSLTPEDVTMDMLTGTYNVRAFTCTLSKTSYTYDGTRKLPTVTVEYNGDELVAGLNYTVNCENNKNPGTATVYISGINNCYDEKSLEFTITLKKVMGFEITSAKASYVKLSWDKAENVTGYIVYQYDFAAKKYVKIKKITNLSKTTYKVKNLQPCTKYRFRVKAYVKSDGKTYKSKACEKKTVYTKPAKVTLKSLTRSKNYKSLKIKWKAASGCTGYTVKIATDKNMKNVVKTYTVKGSSITKLKVKNLLKKKTYYVKVRAYLKKSGTTYYGAYSDVMKSKKMKKKKK